MKKIKKEVKSEGKVVDNIEVTQYDSTAEAVKNLTDKKCLEMINAKVSADACNQARTAKVKPTSAMAQLGRIAKTDPKAKAEIEAILAKYKA